MNEPSDLAALWPERPWAAVSAKTLSAALRVPSMLSFEEAQLYHWLGARAGGLGATVDLGAFAGGSAARLLSGLALSGRPYHLHAYDRFEADPAARARHLPGTVPEGANERDILPLARRHLAPWGPHVTLHPGDIRDRRWTGGPVELLAIDAAKTPAVADHIAAEFFPALLPGRSVVIQQDMLHAAQPWLAVQMLRLAPAFRVLGTAARDVMVFVPRRPITPEDLAAARTEGLDDRSLVAGIREAADHFSAFVERQRFGEMIGRVKANPGIRLAWQLRRGKGAG